MSAHTTTEASQDPVAEQLRHFQNVTIAHPRLVAVKDRLMNAIEGAAPGSLILVLGPAGVGKTTLRLKVEQSLTQGMLSTLESNPGRLPFVSVEAVASVTGNFSWRAPLDPSAEGDERTAGGIEAPDRWLPCRKGLERAIYFRPSGRGPGAAVRGGASLALSLPGRRLHR